MSTPLEKWPKPFREAFCERFGCDTSSYERKMFWRCLYRHAVPFAALIYRINPGFFKEDFDAIREMGLAVNSAMFNHDVNLFYGRIQRHAGFLRGSLHLRASGHRMLRMKREIIRSLPDKTPGLEAD